MAQKVEILPDKIPPKLRPPGGSADSTHPNAPVRLRRTGDNFKKSAPPRDRGKRSF